MFHRRKQYRPAAAMAIRMHTSGGMKNLSHFFPADLPMKRMILIATSFLIVFSLHAVPLTWHFSGTTSSSSQFNSASIGGLSYELRIFLDSDLVGVDPMNLGDVFFTGPHQAEVEIATLGVLSVNPFNNVQYFAPGGLVTGVQFNQPAFSDIRFDSVISADSTHLSPIAPTAPSASNNSLQSGVFGPNGLFLSGPVATFSATTTASVPDGGSTALLLTLALLASGFLRRRK